jgi:hypothetical protein
MIGFLIAISKTLVWEGGWRHAGSVFGGGVEVMVLHVMG